MPIVKTAQAIKTLESGALVEVLATDPGSVKDFAAWSRTTGNELVEQIRGRRHRTASSCGGSEAAAMTTTTLERPATTPLDPLARRSPTSRACRSPPSRPRRAGAKTKELVIVNWSGDLDKVWPVLILSSTAAASGVRCRVFVTFWGLLPFVKDQKRIVGDNWMQKMLTLMQRPGIDHLKLSKMNFLGMGPWMMGSLAQEVQRRQPARAARGRYRHWASSSSRAR